MPEEAMADTIHRAGDSVAARYAPFLRHKAMEMGWPAHVARRISMTVSEGHFVPTFDGGIEMPPDIQNLEYGGADGSSPRPAIGNFFHSKEAQREMSAEFRKHLESLPKKFDNILRGKPA